MRNIKTFIVLFLAHLAHTTSFTVTSLFRQGSISFSAAPRYGPTESTINEDPDEEQVAWEKKDAIRVAQQRVDFQKLINQVLSTTKTEHLPGLMTKNLELLLQMRGYEGVELIQTAIDGARESRGEEGANQVMTAIDFMLSFTEEFVDQAKTMDNGNKELLGKIIRAMTDNKDRLSAREKEEHLDQIMNDEKEKFSTGFLKHIDGECDRIANAPTMTPESSRLLEIMRIIQTRVLEELGKDIGEGALVLGQLMGYDDQMERLAVLEAGLTVRGLDFAKDLAALTGEALEGFQRVPGGVDSDLVQRVQEIDDRLQKYIEMEDVLQ